MGATGTRRAIAVAAAHEFLARGYEGASMSAIAHRLGLTKGALTYHFPTKAALAADLARVVQVATTQADAFAKQAYPHCGARRLLLYFSVMSAWRASEPRYAAGMALFTDSASPTFESAEIIAQWLAMSEDALRTPSEDELSVSPADAAEMLLVTNLAVAFFRDHVRTDPAEPTPLRFLRMALRGIGISRADEYAADVQERYDTRLPALDDAPPPAS